MKIELTPKQEEAFNAVASEKYNLIVYGGAVRGGKSVWGLTTLRFLCKIFPGSRWAVIRKDSERLRKTTIPSFKKLEFSGHLRQNPFEYTSPEGSVILFVGENYATDKDLDWMKGLEVNGFLFEEINECQEQTLYKAFERAGSWIINNLKIQPKPIILATCNPTQGWVKELIYKPYINGELKETFCYIPAKISDNPYLPQSYIDSLSNLPRYEYEVFVNGNWDIQLKTGGEFFKSFELEQHVKNLEYDPDQTLHISIDNNVFPYIAITIWQLQKSGDGWLACQIHELPVKDPNNTASGAGRELLQWLISKNYNNTLFVYGDPTTKQRNTIDDKKRSFLDLFLDPLRKANINVETRFFYKAPPVASTGEFINAIYDGRIEGIRIEIEESCTFSINDYIETKQDIDGGILKKRITDPKTGVSFEKNGHLSDTKRYFLCKIFNDEFNTYKRGVSGYADVLSNETNMNQHSLLQGI
ncbi:MAG: hypothetical protein RL259_584 [Bacteroidota bacterium]|jgi:hypothetical protein